MDYRELIINTHDYEELSTDTIRKLKFRVEVVGKGVEANAELNLTDLRTLLRNWDNRTNLTWQSVMEVGQVLGTALFGEPIREVLLQNLPRPDEDKGLRIRLILRYPLANFPWEYMLINDTGGEVTANHFLGLRRNVSIVRHQENRAPSGAISPASQPTKLVVALASPDTVQPVLRLDEERAAIESAVEAYPERIQAVYSQPATATDLQAKLKEAHLFHFAGHGVLKTEPSELFGKLEGKGELILDDGTGDEYDLGIEQLSKWLRDAGTRVAVLGGCETARRDDRYVWSSVAAHLLNAGLFAVVGMQYKIGNKSATAFSTEFYNALLAGLSIDQAVANGRSAIAGAGKEASNVRDWGVPTLYLADSSNGVVFREFRDNPALDTVREQIEVRVRQRVKELEGIMIGIKLGTVTAGKYDSNQEADKVAKDAQMIAFQAESVGGGQVRSNQTIGETSGNVVGVRLDKLGFD